MWTIINMLLLSYILLAVFIFTVDFANIYDFITNDAQQEISIFKKSLNIRNKIFDIAVITLFLAGLPVSYCKLRKEY